MSNLIEREWLKTLLASTSGERDRAAEEFDAGQKQLLVDRSAFFDRLALFHTGTIAATISFSSVLHQLPKSTGGLCCLPSGLLSFSRWSPH